MPRTILLPEPEGVFTRQQLNREGWSPRAIDARVRRGRWQRLLPGVYVSYSGEATEDDVLRAALAWGGPRAVLTGESALRRHGCGYLDEARPHLLLLDTRSERRPPTICPPGQRALPAPRRGRFRGQGSQLPRSGPVLLVTRTVRPVRVTHTRGLPTAPPLRAAVDGALYVPGLRQCRALLCEVVQRQLVTVDDLRTEVLSRRDPRLRTAQRVLEDLAAGCHSAPECEVRDLVLTSTLLPRPRMNLRLSDVGGPPGYIGDLVLPDARLVTEVDSVEYHGFGATAEETARRRNELTAAGWTVISVTPRDIRQRPRWVLHLIERAYAAGLTAA
ncbi:MAG: type IV toxin-antitoxin system AbiEi family antitoxin domain-containing protein [Actinomycetales bacterium]